MLKSLGRKREGLRENEKAEGLIFGPAITYHKELLTEVSTLVDELALSFLEVFE